MLSKSSPSSPTPLLSLANFPGWSDARELFVTPFPRATSTLRGGHSDGAVHVRSSVRSGKIAELKIGSFTPPKVPVKATALEIATQRQNHRANGEAARMRCKCHAEATCAAPERRSNCVEYAVPEESKLAELSAKLPDVGAVLESCTRSASTSSSFRVN